MYALCLVLICRVCNIFALFQPTKHIFFYQYNICSLVEPDRSSLVKTVSLVHTKGKFRDVLKNYDRQYNSGIRSAKNAVPPSMTHRNALSFVYVMRVQNWATVERSRGQGRVWCNHGRNSGTHNKCITWCVGIGAPVRSAAQRYIAERVRGILVTITAVVGRTVLLLFFPLSAARPVVRAPPHTEHTLPVNE